jgi:hypothetical protein
MSCQISLSPRDGTPGPAGRWLIERLVLSSR